MLLLPGWVAHPGERDTFDTHLATGIAQVQLTSHPGEDLLRRVVGLAARVTSVAHDRY